jgi:cyclin-dependent kinase 9
LVFEFCEHDLAGLLANKNVTFSLAEKKKVIQQLLEGLYWVHKNKILHRDMKAANILINKQGILKLADFGLARPYSIPKRGQKSKYTNRVVTLWYRPPELLLGTRDYGPPIDVWGAGCVMAEMWTRLPIMQGKVEQDQLIKIQKLCGGINPSTWPGVEQMPLWEKMQFPQETKFAQRIVTQRLKVFIKDNAALDLIEKLLTLKPQDRIDCDTALNHDFFWTDPMPEPLNKTLKPLDKSMFEYLVTNPVCTLY